MDNRFTIDSDNEPVISNGDRGPSAPQLMEPEVVRQIPRQDRRVGTGIPIPETVDIEGKPYYVMSVDGSRTEWRTSVNSLGSDVLHFPSNYGEIELDDVRCTTPDSQWRKHLDEFCFEFGSKGVAVGSMARMYGEKQSKLNGFCAKLMASKIFFDLKESIPIALVISLPHPDRKQFEQAKAEILSQIKTECENIGQFANDTHRLNIDLTKVFFNPEGLNALLWTDYQRIATENEKCPNFKKGGTIVIDMGHEHTTFAYCLNMRFQSVVSVSYTDLSMSTFCTDVAKRAKIPNPESLELIKALWQEEGNRICHYRGKPYPLDKEIRSLYPDYAQSIKTRFEEWIPDAQINFALINGGGGAFFAPILSQILSEGQIKPWLADPYRYANVLGGFLYGKSVLEKMQIV